MAFIKVNFKSASKGKVGKWLSRMAKGTIEPKQNKPGHCNNYSTRACLSCGNCWYDPPK